MVLVPIEGDENIPLCKTICEAEQREAILNWAHFLLKGTTELEAQVAPFILILQLYKIFVFVSENAQAWRV